VSSLTRGSRIDTVFGAEFKSANQLNATTSRRISSPLPYHRGTRATGPEILKSFRTGKIRKEENNPSRLPSLRGFLPEVIRVRQRRSSQGIAEHRQMGACLRADPAADPKSRREQSGWSARRRRLSRRLARTAAKAFFVEAGEAPPRLMLSAVFCNDPDYRRFLPALAGHQSWDSPCARRLSKHAAGTDVRTVRAVVFSPSCACSRRGNWRERVRDRGSVHT